MTWVSILFATRNGAHTLPRMLDTVECLEAPKGGFEVVAVDNGSSDASRTILQERAARLPITVVSEPRRGKNIALNAGLALVEGEVVAFTDDDILLPADWLVALAAIAAEKREYDIFGGPIYPVWEEAPPDWVLRCVPRGFFALTDFPEGPVGPTAIWGGNMAVRAGVFREHSFAEGFEMHSETEFTVRAGRSGHRCWHFHAAPVGHIIRPHQMTAEWHRQRAYNHGRWDRRRFHGADRRDGAGRFGTSLQAAGKLVTGACHLTLETGRLVASRLSGDFDSHYKASLDLCYWQGRLAGELAALTARPAAAPPGMRPNGPPQPLAYERDVPAQPGRQ